MYLMGYVLQVLVSADEIGLINIWCLKHGELQILKTIEPTTDDFPVTALSLYTKISEGTSEFLLLLLMFDYQGLARTQIPTNINYAVEFPTFGEIAGVSSTEVQWKSLALREPP